ncbi:glutathione S-transferase family protein [Marivita sp. S2033]|uniref:glutathione S-transferase family protein n=1 Tax=Marivita sp. S2033 TaxID=3373187 RepID=UPI0039824466
MADYTFFFNPMSRAQIARWALHEARADYDSVMVPWEDKPDALIKANPMAKVPTIIHHHTDGDRVVSEAAAICHYLAEAEAPDLLPQDAEKADYFRWMFFAAGPLEQAITAKALGWTVSDKEQVMAGFGSYERTVDALEGWLSAHDYVSGARFTMADVYVGSAVDWGLQFKSLPERAAFSAYQARIVNRPAYNAAKAIDYKLIEEMQP